MRLDGADSRALSGGSGDEELVHLLIRFPNGKRVERSFPANHTLQVPSINRSWLMRVLNTDLYCKCS